MKSFLLILLSFIVYNGNFMSQTLDVHLQVEVDKWQKELVLNGEVGPPCYEDYQKWMEDYPNYYYGLQKIKSVNNPTDDDNIKDALFFFEAINCVGGSSGGSDFAMLVYSNNDVVLTNKNISPFIENKIKKTFSEDGFYNIDRVQIFYKSYIGGEFYAWTDDDPNCCASYKGKFKFNRSNLSVSLVY